jgi:hypothetical protein
MRLRRALRILIICGVTALLFPLVIAAAKGLLALSDENERLSHAHRLLNEYWAYSPPPIRLASIDSDYDIRRCGYPVDLFDPRDIGVTDRWTPRNGYWALVLWRISEQRDARDRLRAEFLRSRLSAFSNEFLRMCIRQSAFAPACAAYLRGVLVGAGWDDYAQMPPGQRLRGQETWDRAICSYLDGYAARTGRPLADRQTESPAR